MEEEKKTKRRGQIQMDIDIGNIFLWFGLFGLALSSFILATIYGTETDMKFLYFVCLSILCIGRKILKD